MRFKWQRFLLSFIVIFSILISSSVQVRAWSGISLYVNYIANVVNVYYNDQPLYAFVCSTGSATPRSGTYYTQAKWRWRGLFGGVYGQYATCINGNILFHSVPYTETYEWALEWWEYDKLGTSASMGCVRLQVCDAQWIYDNCPIGTPVTFYGSEDPGPWGKPKAFKISNAPEDIRNWDPTDTNPYNAWNYNEDFTKYTFNAQQYLKYNPDLKNSVGTDEFSLKVHWLTTGIREKRRASDEFDLSFYMKLYPNIAKEYGDDEYAYVQYYNKVGRDKGQIGSADNPKYKTASGVSVRYRTHLEKLGWQECSYNGVSSGSENLNYRLEALEVYIDSPYDLGVKYRAHVQNIGWQNWVQNGNFAGSTGCALRAEAFQIELTGAAASSFDICYRVYVQGRGWTEWVNNGQVAGTTGQALRLESIQIKVVSKGTSNATVSYSSHTQAVGWEPTVTDGLNSCVTGRSLRLEGVRISVNEPLGIGIEYRAHVEKIGWQNWVRNGQLAGSTGCALRLEGLQIRLIGANAGMYDVYYQTYVQGIGWTGWAKNGEKCGSEGLALRVESIKVIILPKGSPPPGSTIKPFYHG